MKLRVLLLVVLIAGFLVTNSPRRAEANTIIVDGVICTLTDAILSANTDSAVGGCNAGLGSDTIMLNIDVTLTSADTVNSTERYGTYAGLPDISSDITIQAGTGSIIERDSSYGCSFEDPNQFRIFHVLAGNTLTLDRLTIRNGCTAPSGNINSQGGAIWIQYANLNLYSTSMVNNTSYAVSRFPGYGGALYIKGSSTIVIDNSNFENNLVIGVSSDVTGGGFAWGGAIFMSYAATTLTIQNNTQFINNIAQGGNSTGTTCCYKGGDGDGGAIYVGLGSTYISDTTFINNKAIGGHSIAGNGGVVRGGSIYVSYLAPDITILNSDFIDNTAQGGYGQTWGGDAYGGAIDGNVSLTDVIFSNNNATAGNGVSDHGGNAYGGAHDGGGSLMENIIFDNNKTTGGNSLDSYGGDAYGGGTAGPGSFVNNTYFVNNQAVGGDGVSGGNAYGGGYYDDDGWNITAVTIKNNLAQGGDSTTNTAGNAYGGGMYGARGLNSITNLTIANNRAFGGNSTINGIGGNAYGGGWMEFRGTNAAGHITIANNEATGGTGVGGDGLSYGGGFYNASINSLILNNSIFTNNTTISGGGSPTPNDCDASSTITSNGYNLVEVPGTCIFSAIGDQTGIDGRVGASADNGCSTTLPDGSCLQTLFLLSDSPGIDAGSCTVSGATFDQRESPRPYDILSLLNVEDGCDIGAVEMEYLQPTISLSPINVTHNEGNADTTNYEFTVTLSNVSLEVITVDYSTTDDTATIADDDYVDNDNTLTFNPGDPLTQTITVLVNGDEQFETDENFTVSLDSATNATIDGGNNSATGTITNDDTPPEISLSPANVTHAEGDSGTTSYDFTVTLSNTSSEVVTVDYSASDDTATIADNDYIDNDNTLTFNPGDPLTQNITVEVNGDTQFELNEDFTVTLDSSTNSTIDGANNSATGTITNDDSQPEIMLSPANVTHDEGDSGTTAYDFTVTLSNASSEVVTVDYTTNDDTATTVDSDYVDNDNILTFNPGDPLTQNITVLVNGDTQFETDEDFTVSLDSSTNSTIDGANDSATGTITNDDNQPVVSMGRPYVLWAGATSCSFSIAISGGSSGFNFVGDIHSNGRMNTHPGVTVYGHGTIAEFSPSENAIWIPSFNNPRLVDPQPDDPLQYDIEDYAPGGTKWQEAVDDPNAVAVSYPCTSSGDTMTESWLTSEGYLSGGVLEDGLYYAACNMQLRQPINSTATSFVTTGEFEIRATGGASPLSTLQPYIDDLLIFADRQHPSSCTLDVIKIAGNEVALNGILYAPNGKTDISVADFILDGSIIADTIEMASATSTITYQEFPDAPIASMVPHDEGNSGTTTYEFDVTLSNPSSEVVTVNYSVTDGTATVIDGDYVDNDGTLTFNPGESLTKTITVLVNGDEQFEPDEDFTVSLDASTNSTIHPTDNSATGVINNDDGQPVVMLNAISSSQNEGDAGTIAFEFAVTLTNGSIEVVTVDYSTSDGTATVGEIDFADNDNTLTFNPGDPLTQNITIEVNGDTDFEADEYFTVTLNGATNATIDVNNNYALGTILNDDAGTPNDGLILFDPSISNTAIYDAILDNASKYAYLNTPPTNTAPEWVMGDWNGDGVKTPGYFDSGAFRYTNDIGPSVNWSAGFWLGNAPGRADVVAGRFASGFANDTGNDCIGWVDSNTNGLGDLRFSLKYWCDMTTTPQSIGGILSAQWLATPLPDTNGFSGTFQFAYGDWDNDGLDEPGIRRSDRIVRSDNAPSEGAALYGVGMAQRWDTADGDGPGVHGLDDGLFVAGDWNGDGVDTWGVVYDDDTFYYRDVFGFNPGPFEFSSQTFTSSIATPRQVDSHHNASGGSTSPAPASPDVLRNLETDNQSTDGNFDTSRNVEADLSVSKAGNYTLGEVGLVGDSIVWTITVSNTGSAPANGVEITDNVPSELRVDDALTDTGTITVHGQTVIFAVESLGVGETLYFQVVTTILEQPVGGQFANSVNVVLPDGEGSGNDANLVANSTVASVDNLPATGYTPKFRW